MENRVIKRHMNKHDEWFKSLIEAFEKDSSWDLATSKTAAYKPIPDRDKTQNPGKKKSSK